MNIKFTDGINKFSIKIQIMAIMVLSLGGIITIAFGGNYTAKLVESTTNLSIEATDKARFFGELSRYALEMRRSEKNYIANPVEAKITGYNQAILEAKSLINRLNEKLQIQSNTDILASIEKGFMSHEAQFRAVGELTKKLGVDATKGQLGALNSAAANITEQLGRIKKKMFDPGALNGINVPILKLHILQKDFVETGDTTYLKQFDSGFVSFEKALKQSFLSKSQKATIKEVMTDYRNKFRDWSATRDTFNKGVLALSTIYDAFAPNISKMKDAYTAKSKEATLTRVSMQETSSMMLTITSAILALMIALISFVIATNIAQKIAQLASRMKRLANGETQEKIPFVRLRNELGEMAKSMLIFKENAIARMKDETEKQKRTDEELEKTQFVGGLIEGFQARSTTSIGVVQTASDRLEDVSKNLNISAIEMQNQSLVVTGNVQNTSENVVGAASAAEEMVASISEIAEQASLSTNIAEQAISKTNETVAVISQLGDSASHIEQVVKLIEEIAEQTNLLALNATIEAARAGDAGKGFAVVANEVKSLANQTAKATEEIAERVGAIQKDSGKANDAIIDVENIIEQLSNASLGVASAVEEQSAVINEIAQNVTSASVLSTKSAESMETVGVSIDKTKDVSNDVYGLANDLNKQVASLEEEISTFLKGVKSA